MNGTSATYGFLPWFKRGLSAAIERVDGSAGGAPRAAVPIRLTFNAGAQAQQVTAHLALYGPGEIAGIDSRVIIRTDPRPDVTDAESNYFPLIEFDQPDFPWRFTPAVANAQDRLRPWIVLIVLADEELAASTHADVVHGRLPTISLPDARALPNLAQSWAWAHVQLSGVTREQLDDAAEIARIDRDEPHRILSRLLCARHLKARTPYTAYLVPAFERGRLAGLNEELPDDLDALAPAWQSGSLEPVVLPVYYQWRFQTADAGDFESLVRELLPPRVLPDTVGRRAMDASDPGSGLSPATRADGAPLTLEGALMSPASRNSSPVWTDREPFRGELESLLNIPDDLLVANSAAPRIIAPPLYGRWHAGRARLQALAEPSWFDELNSDPQRRALAGLGVRVVQSQQNQLMAGAWDQVEGILTANQQLREAQLGCAVATRLLERDILTLDPETAVQITAPILGRVMASPRTILATLRQTAVPRGALDSQFRRVTRPLGHLGRRLSRVAGRTGRFGVPGVPTGRVLARLNRRELPHAAPPAGAKLRSVKKVVGGLVSAHTSYGGWSVALFVLALVLLATAAALTAVSSPLIFSLVGSLALAALIGVAVTSAAARRHDLLVQLQSGTLSAEAVESTSAATWFMPTERGFPATQSAAAFSRAQATANFQTALARVADRLQRKPTTESAKPSADFTHLRARVVEELRPERAIVNALNMRIGALPGGVTRDAASCGPILAAPTFDQPMYEPLRDLSQEWLLPGVGNIPPNTISLLVTNQRFVESYMVGLNHEMARELLWHEYPTDQRGTCFRQFWDVRGYAGPAAAQLNDIAPIHQWTGNTALGTHRPTVRPPGDDLVLLVRGRLLLRYPNTVICAIRATLEGSSSVAQGGQRTLGDTVRYPSFHGALSPDISFVGFDLRREEVVGSPSSADPADQGWFFVFQEQPTTPRFALDVPGGPFGAPVTSWADLSWGHLVRSFEELDALTYIDLDPPVANPGDAQLPQTPGAPAGEPGLAWHAADGSRSSDLAYITLQKPFRVAVHASDMLPPD